jgi:hypothetical protein
MRRYSSGFFLCGIVIHQGVSSDEGMLAGGMHGGRPNSGEADSAGGDILLRSPAPARKAYPGGQPRRRRQLRRRYCPPEESAQVCLAGGTGLRGHTTSGEAVRPRR